MGVGIIESVVMLTFLGGIIFLIGKVISNGPQNNPTWKGIIISALIGMLPFYLILCFMGYMGEERNELY